MMGTGPSSHTASTMDENVPESNSPPTMSEDVPRRGSDASPVNQKESSDHQRDDRCREEHKNDDDDHDDSPNRVIRAPANDDKLLSPEHSALHISKAAVSDQPNRSTLRLRPTKRRQQELGRMTGNGPPTPRKNELTHLLPGYTAPMALHSSSLDKYRPPGGLESIRQQALAKDHPIQSSSIRRRRPVGSLVGGGGTTAPPVPSKDWFRMAATPITDEVKKDLQLLRNRNYMDPKRFYKSNDPAGKHVQIGTVVEGASEYYSSRLTKKQRRTNMLDEVLADADASHYAQNKYKSMQRDKTAQAQKRRKFFKKRGPQKRR